MKQALLFFAVIAVSITTCAQNVGIGTTTPLANLHIRNGISGVSPFPSSFLVVESNANTYVNLLSPAVNETAILFGVPGSAANGVIMYNNPATPNGFQFRNNGNLTRMVVNNNGDVGIGTSTPAAKLHISNGGGSLALFGPDGSNTQLYVGTANNQGLANTAQVIAYDGNLLIDPAQNKKVFIGIFQPCDVLLTTAGGNVGIGTNAPNQKLQVSGNICYTGTIAACSDIRYKKNIVPLENVLNEVMSLHAIYYNWDKEKFADKSFNDERQLGFSAQEIKKLFPEIVQTDAEGYMAVDYSRLTPVLVEAIKEQQQQIYVLKKLVEKLMK